MEEFSALEFVRLKIPRLIPSILVEAVKGNAFSPEEFYRYQEELVGSPYNFLYALIDEEKKIHGFLWLEKNALDGTLFVNTFSVDKAYWGKGSAIPHVVAFLKELKAALHAPRVFWITTNDKFFTKHGFRRSKQCLMEYNDDE